MERKQHRKTAMKTSLLSALLAVAATAAALLQGEEHAASQQVAEQRDQPATKKSAEQGLLRALRKDDEDAEDDKEAPFPFPPKKRNNWGWGNDGYGNSLAHWLSHVYELDVDVPKACGPFCPAGGPPCGGPGELCCSGSSCDQDFTCSEFNNPQLAKLGIETRFCGKLSIPSFQTFFGSIASNAVNNFCFIVFVF